MPLKPPIPKNEDPSYVPPVVWAGVRQPGYFRRNELTKPRPRLTPQERKQPHHLRDRFPKQYIAVYFDNVGKPYPVVIKARKRTTGDEIQRQYGSELEAYVIVGNKEIKLKTGKLLLDRAEDHRSLGYLSTADKDAAAAVKVVKQALSKLVGGARPAQPAPRTTIKYELPPIFRRHAAIKPFS